MVYKIWLEYGLRPENFLALKKRDVMKIDSLTNHLQSVNMTKHVSRTTSL